MTTKVTIEANHGWPVDVFAHDKPADAGGNTTGVLLGRVPANETQAFYVHSSRDLFIHEVQPDEIKAEQDAADAEFIAKQEAAAKDAVSEDAAS